MKKTALLIIFCLLIVLSGCAQNAPLLAEAIKNNQDSTSNEANLTLQIQTNIPTDGMDKQSKAIFDTLKTGVRINLQQKTKDTGHVRIAPMNPKALNEALGWNDSNPLVDLYVDKNDSYVKTSFDKKALMLPGSTIGAIGLDQNEPNVSEQLTKTLMENSKYNFKNIKTIGDETLTLPNGTKTKTTHIKLDVDLAEAKDYFSYANEELMNLLKEKVSIEQQAAAEQDFNHFKEQLNSYDIEKLKADGWDFQLTEDAWMNPDKYMVQQQMNVMIQVPVNVLGEDLPFNVTGLKTINVNIHLAEQMWNFNQSIHYDIPQGDNLVTIDQLNQNPRFMNAFDPNSPLHAIAQDMVVEGAKPFNDVDYDHWAFDNISTLRKMGVVHGYNENDFRPNNPVTRAEFIAMTVNALRIQHESNALHFNDKNQIPDWANSSMQTAVQMGIISGYEDQTLRPNQSITRAEMIAILNRAVKMPKEDSSFKLPFNDANEIPDWAKESVRHAAVNGLAKGTTGNLFAPKANATRAETAALLYRIIFNIDRQL